MDDVTTAPSGIADWAARLGYQPLRTEADPEVISGFGDWEVAYFLVAHDDRWRVDRSDRGQRRPLAAFGSRDLAERLLVLEFGARWRPMVGLPPLTAVAPRDGYTIGSERGTTTLTGPHGSSHFFEDRLGRLRAIIFSQAADVDWTRFTAALESDDGAGVFQVD